jgi:uncharacterized protein YrrD
VTDICFDQHWRLTGLILSARRWWFATVYRIVTWDEVLVCGSDAVLISGKAAVTAAGDDDIQRTFQNGPFRLKDLPVVTREGRQLGRVSDVYFNPDMGTPIVGYELTDGFVSDLMEGRKWLKTPVDPEEVTLGENVILVPTHSEDALEVIVTS